MTLRGAYNIGEVAASAFDSLTLGISFGMALASDPTWHLLFPGDTTSECPGTVAAPEAQAGHLCVYVREGSNASVRILDPVRGQAAAVSSFGFVVEVTAVTSAFYYSRGSWAVTAP